MQGRGVQQHSPCVLDAVAGEGEGVPLPRPIPQGMERLPRGDQTRGLMALRAESTVLCNLSHGPWDGSAWFRKLREGAGEYWSRAEAGDPLN